MTRALITDPDLAPEGARGPVRRGPPLHRLQRVHCALPRGHPDCVHPEPAHRPREDDAPSSSLDRPAARRRGGRRAGGPRRRRGGRPRKSRSSNGGSGGQVALARTAPMRGVARLPRPQLRSAARRRQVDVRLENVADSATVAALGPDAVVLPGARPTSPRFRWTESRACRPGTSSEARDPGPARPRRRLGRGRSGPRLR